MIQIPNEVGTLVDLLRWRARAQPDQVAYTFLPDGETQAVRITYAGLDRQARAIAARLQDLSTPGDRGLIIFPPGLEFLAAFFGCLYAGVTVIAPYPPRRNRPMDQIRAMVSDGQPTVALATVAQVAEMQGRFGEAPYLQGLRWLATDQVASADAERWREPDITPATLAFFQYTSGSTAAPKGVMLSHGNLMHNSLLIGRFFGHTAQSRGLIWLPPYHDMGLIGGIFQPLYAGFPVTLMAPVHFLQRPLRWLQAVTRTRATTSGGPNFAYELCVRTIKPEQRAGLDLSSWKVAFSGAEPVRPDTLERFAETFAPCGFRREAFYPCYGLAEGTLIVTGGEVAAAPVVQAVAGRQLEDDQVVASATADEDTRMLVGCGKSSPDQQVVIADPLAQTRCAPGQVGEVWVAGPSVAQGYWNRPEQTEQTFRARLADTGEGPFMRTGDLGFLREDGELFITGRIKDMLIFRGKKHYPQDIELTVEQSDPGVRPTCCAAFVARIKGVEGLVVAAEIDRQHRRRDLQEIVGAIRQAVAEVHELQTSAVVLLKPGSIPKTPSGKIQRHACRDRFLAGTLEVLGEEASVS